MTATEQTPGARLLVLVAFLTICLYGLTGAEAAERRLLMNQDSDYFGFDYDVKKDIELTACEQNCLNDRQCQAFTYNVSAGWCFLKSGVGELRSISGAVSGRVVEDSGPSVDNKALRLSELDFIPQSYIDQARRFEGQLREQPKMAPSSFELLLELAEYAANRGDLRNAIAHYRAAVGHSPDRFDLWKSLTGVYSRVSMTRTTDTARSSLLSAAINAYLRSEADGERAALLARIAGTLAIRPSNNDRRPAIAAYQASLALRKDADVQAGLEDFVSRYGFRVVDHRIEAGGPEPRICVMFSDDLPDGLDAQPFISAQPEANLAINAEERQVCLNGLRNGERYAITVRPGLPAADGQELIKSVSLKIFVPDRPPSVRFEGQAYVLPAGGEASLPITSINTDLIEAQVLRLGDRQLARAISDRLFLSQIYEYQADEIAEQSGEKVWQGTIEVSGDLNREITSAIPVSEVVSDLKPGVYVITARAANAQNDRYWYSKVTQWFVVTDLGISNLSGSDGFHVFVRSLTTAQPLAGVALQLIARNNEILGRATTDQDGYAVMPAGLVKGTGGSAPALLAAEGEGGDYNFIDLTRPALDLTDRGVDGRPAPGPLDVFLTTERGIYRPGEVVHVTALVRDGKATAVTDVPLFAIVKRPDGIEATRFNLTDQGLGGAYSSYRLGNSAMRGSWTLGVYMDDGADAFAETTFLVEDFVPERLDFELTPSAEIIDRDRPGRVSLTARFLYGQPASNLEAEGETVVRPVDEVAAFPNYRFGLVTDGFDPLLQPLKRRFTDAEGKATLDLELRSEPKTSRPLEATINVRVLDQGGRPVERSLTLPVTDREARIGIRPLFADAVEIDQPAAFQIIAVDAQGKRSSATDLTWELIRIVTRYQWYQTNGRWNFEPLEYRERIGNGRVDVGTDEPARIEVSPEWGAHELVVRDRNSASLPASVRFTAGWYVEPRAIDTPEALRLTFDKPRYQVGDIARVHIDASYPGIAHLMVIDNRLISSKLVEIPKGGMEVGLPVTADWGPGAYVSAALHRPMDLAARQMPARSIGIGWAEVDPGDRQLDVAIEFPRSPQPRQPFSTRVHLANTTPGEQAYVAVAAVNAGILNLTGFEPPAPDEWYFAQRRLGTQIRDVYGYLINRMQGARGIVRSGGDGPLGRLYNDPPPDLVAMHSGIVAADANGIATVDFDMPDFNGALRVMVMAWTGQGVGSAVEDIIVRDPVVISTSNPLYLAPGDQSRLHFDLSANEDGSGFARLDIKALDGSIMVEDKHASHDLNLVSNIRSQVVIPVRAASIGPGELNVALTLSSGDTLEKTISIPVRNNQPQSLRSSVVSLAPGSQLQLDPQTYAGFIPDTVEVFVSASGAGKLNVPAILSALDRYPYGCTEQLTSRALPLLYLNDVALATGHFEDRDSRERLSQAIRAILANQAAGGSFGLWRPESEGDLWLDAYVTDFLTRARREGHEVPDLALDRALGNLKNRLAYADRSSGDAIAYALYVLAASSRASIGDLRYYSETAFDSLSTPLAKAHVAAALAFYGDAKASDAVFRRAIADLERARNTREWRSDYGSRLRDAAAILTLASESKSSAVDTSRLSEQIGQDWTASAYLSTQEHAWTLLAAHALIEEARQSASDGGVDALYHSYSSEEVDRRPIIRNRGARVLDVLLNVRGVPQLSEPASGNFYEITRSYYSLEGEEADLARIGQGERLVAVLTVTSMESRDARLIIDDPLPAGFEIDNPHILKGGNVAALKWLDLSATPAHIEFRSDRFVAALDRKPREATRFQFAYIVRAVSPGRFAHPAAIVEDMYRPERRARTDTSLVQIVGPLN